MAREDFRIDTVAGRAKLIPDREPYWHRIERGCHVGFRKLKQGDGTWIARWRTPEGKQAYNALGHHPDFDTAVRVARSWFAQCEGGSPKVISIAEACRRYVDDRRIAKGTGTANDAEGRFDRHVFSNPIGKIELGKVKTSDIAKWLNAQVKSEDDFEDEDEETDDLIRRSKDSANRNLASLKAALNMAYRQGLASTSAPWDRVLKFPGVGARRHRYMTLEERRALIKSSSPDLARLIKALTYTGARPGEIANAKVRSCHPNGILELDGKTGRRPVRLHQEAFDFFQDCAGSRDGDEYLIARENNKKWDRYSWRDAVQSAREAANLPSDVVLYNIRHAVISEMIIGGIDPVTVARRTGTSLEMINKHYGHLRADQSIELISKLPLV